MVCESTRAFCELVFPFLDRGKATTVDFVGVTSPVLGTGGECDRIAPAGGVRQTAASYRHPTLGHHVLANTWLPRRLNGTGSPRATSR